ncbi:hypothetical protein [Nocardia sp. NPDC059228]|uniref:hypothetical protein n=1 Tax=Nocardia sp. NPDC059228 TaxID=3346777 RepID=UPI0036C31C72
MTTLGDPRDARTGPPVRLDELPLGPVQYKLLALVGAEMTVSDGYLSETMPAGCAGG